MGKWVLLLTCAKLQQLNGEDATVEAGSSKPFSTPSTMQPTQDKRLCFLRLEQLKKENGGRIRRKAGWEKTVCSDAADVDVSFVDCASLENARTLAQ